MSGHLISFEGLDGVGKSTQVELLGARLQSIGVPHVAYREPGGTPLGEELRRLLQLGLARGTISELLLFVAARAELVEREIQPALAADKVVLLDRYIDSTWAYQGARGIPDELLDAANILGTRGLMPNLTFLLDLVPAAATQRRNHDAAKARERQIDCIEHRGDAYFSQVRLRYLELARSHSRRIVTIDAALQAGTMAETIYRIVSSRLNLRVGDKEPVAV